MQLITVQDTSMFCIMNDACSAASRKHARHAIERVFVWLQAGAEMDPESKWHEIAETILASNLKPASHF